LHILPKQITAGAADLTAEIEVVAAENTTAHIVLENLRDKSIAARRDVNLVPGNNHLKLDFVIPHPALWWPNGLGSHPLYSFKAQLTIAGQLVDQSTTRTGLRALKLRQQPDDSGKSFALKSMASFAFTGAALIQRRRICPSRQVVAGV